MIEQAKRHLPDRRQAAAFAGATLASLTFAAGRAHAQPSTGGTEAAPAVTHQGGVTADPSEMVPSNLTPEQMEINDEAQQYANDLGSQALRIPKARKSRVYAFQDLDGTEMGLQTVTVTAPVEKSHKKGEYQFQIIAALAPGTKSLDVNQVSQAFFISGIPNKKGMITSSYVQDSLGVNLNTNAFQASVKCKPFGGGSGESSLADVIPITPESQTMTHENLTATYYQMKGLVTAASHKHPVSYELPAFNGQNTTYGSAS